MTKKSLLIKDTTVDERMAIVKESLNFCDGDCDGVDMDDMYDDYIFGRRELADINLEFSRKHAGEVVPTRPSAPRGMKNGLSGALLASDNPFFLFQLRLWG